MIDPQINEQQQQQDIQTLQTGLETAEVPPISEGVKTAGLIDIFSRKVAERAVKSELGKLELEKREAEKVSEVVAERAEELRTTPVEQLDENEPYQINFDTIKSADDLRVEFGVLNEQNKVAIQKQRRDIIPDEELKSLASDLSSDPATIKKVLGLKEGEILGPEYILSMKQTLSQSAKRLKELSEKIVGGDATDKDKIDFHKQWEFHSQFTTQFMGVRAEYGRGLRALGVKTDDMDGSDLTNIMNRMSAGTLDEQTMAQQIMMAEDTKSITKTIQNQSKGLIGKAGDFFSELFISSILSGPQTHIVNSVSNAIKTVSMPLDTAVASMIKADGADIVQKGEATAQLKGIMEANIEAIKTAWKVMRTGEAYGAVDKLDVDYQKAISANALGIKEGAVGSTVDVFGKIVRFSTDNLMGAEDAYFKVLNERGTLRRLAHRKAVEQKLSGEEYTNFITYFMDNPSASAIKEAREVGLESTFQQEMGGIGKDIQSFRNKVWGGKFIMPFVKTPINLLYEGFVERTPLGFLSKKYKDAINEGGAKAQMAKAKMAVGTSINTLILATFANMEYGSNPDGFEIIGAYPSDKKLRELMKDAGIKENSISWTDENGTKQYMSFDRLEPFNSILKLYANIIQVQKIANLDDMNPDFEKEFNKMAGGISLAFAEATVNQTFMKGIKDFIDAFTQGNDIKKLQSLASNLATGMIPHSSALKTIARDFDDQIKDADTFLTRVQKSLPTLGEDIPPILDNYGKPLVYENNFTPSYMKMAQAGEKDKVRNEVYRVTESTKTVPVYKPRKNFGGYRMTAQEYYDYVNFATNDIINGKKFYDRLKDTMNSRAYKKATDHVKSMYLKEVRNAMYDYAKAKLFQKYPHIQKYDLDKKQYKNKLLKGQ